MRAQASGFKRHLLCCTDPNRKTLRQGAGNSPYWHSSAADFMSISITVGCGGEKDDGGDDDDDDDDDGP